MATVVDLLVAIALSPSNWVGYGGRTDVASRHHPQPLRNWLGILAWCCLHGDPSVMGTICNSWARARNLRKVIFTSTSRSRCWIKHSDVGVPFFVIAVTVFDCHLNPRTLTTGHFLRDFAIATYWRNFCCGLCDILFTTKRDVPAHSGAL